MPDFTPVTILFINQFYPPDVAPTGQFLADQAEACAQRGHRVRVICSRQRYEVQSVADGREACFMGDRLTVRRMAAFGFGRRSRCGRILDYGSFFFTTLWAALTGPRPDVVVCLTTPPYIGLVGLAMRWLRGVRYVQWVMDLYPDAMVAHGMLRERSALNRLLRWLTARILCGADAVWALGPCMKKKIDDYLPDPVMRGKIEAIPLWAGSGQALGDRVESQGIEALRAEYGLNGRMTVMYSGNMGLGHDFDTLSIDATRRGKLISGASSRL